MQGGNQSIQSLAMVIGPLVGGTLYTQVGHVTPFWFGACMVVLAIIATLLAVPAIRVHRTLTERVDVSGHLSDGDSLRRTSERA